MIYLKRYNIKDKTTDYLAYYEAENEYGNDEYLCYCCEKDEEDPPFVRLLQFHTQQEMENWMKEHASIIIDEANHGFMVIPEFEND